jgi:hypothetical protein
MKKKIQLILALVFLLFPLGGIFANDQMNDLLFLNATNNLPEGVGVKTTVTELADVSVQDLQIVQGKEDRNHFQLDFKVFNNGGEVQGGLIYGIELIKRSNPQSQEMISLDAKYFPQETFSLSANSFLQKKIEYKFPSFFAGEAELWVRVKNASGMSLGSVFGKVNLIGDGQYVELANPCYFTVEGDNKEYSLLQGVDVRKEESLFLNCQAINQTNEEIKFQLEQTTFRRSEVNEKERVALLGAEFVLAAKESRLLKMKLELPTDPQAYQVAVKLKKEGALFSNTVFGHYVLAGQSGMINLASPDKNFYSAGETAQLAVLLSRSADSFVGARNRGSQLSDPQLEIRMEDGAGKFCAENFKEKVDYFGELKKIALPIEKDCADFSITLQLKDGDKILDEKKITVASAFVEKMRGDNENSASKSKERNFFLLALGSVIVLVLMGVFIYMRKRKKTASIWPVLFLSLFSLSGLAFFNPAEAKTVQLENCFLLSVTDKNATNSTFNSLNKCETSGMDCHGGLCYWLSGRMSIYTLFTNVYYLGCDSHVFSNPANRAACIAVAGSATRCAFFTAVGYPCPASADLANPDAIYWMPFYTFGCYCDRATFNFNLNKTAYSRGENMQICGEITADATCSNGLTTGLKSDHDGLGNSYDWVVGSTGAISLNRNQSSGSYCRSNTVSYDAPLGGSEAYFNYGFLHGKGLESGLFVSNSTGSEYGSSTIRYNVTETCSSTGCPVACSVTCSGVPCGSDNCKTPCFGTKIDGACCVPTNAGCAANTCINETCNDGCKDIPGTKIDGACCVPNNSSCAANTCINETCNDGCKDIPGTKTDGVCCISNGSCACTSLTCTANDCGKKIYPACIDNCNRSVTPNNCEITCPSCNSGNWQER